MHRLIIRPGAMGDFIVSIPAMRCLRASYTEMWATSQNLPLARFADCGFSIVSTGLDLLGIVETDGRLLERLRRFDSIVSWYGANRPDFRELVTSLGLPFRFFQALPPGTGESPVHATDFYMEQARTITACTCAPVPRVECPALPDGDFAVIQPFSGSYRKNWPLERYRALASRLEARLPVRWCAGPEEELPQAVRLENLYDLACWLSTARIYVGNDSGVTHLAAAVGTPVVALFGPTDPRVWAPRGPNVTVVARESMELIGVDEVSEECLRLLS